MNKTKFIATAILTIILASALNLDLYQLPIGIAFETNIVDRVLVFLRDVVHLDMTKYLANLRAGPTSLHRSELGGLEEITGVYDLTSDASKLEVLFRFTNNTFSSCLLDVRTGSPQFSQPPPLNPIENAKGFIQRFQVFSRDLNLTGLQEMLDNVDSSGNTTKLSGNLRLQITIDSSSEHFNWVNTYKGADYTGFGFYFKKGVFWSFGSDMTYYKIGCTDVNVSREDAINISFECAKNFSYSYAGKQIAQFQIVNERVTARLLTKSRDEPLVMYPYWMVDLPLNDIYPGDVFYIEVQIWADIGKVISYYPMGADIMHGTEPSPSPASSPSPTPTPTPSQTPFSSPSITPNASSSQSPSPSSSPTPSITPSSSPTQHPTIEPSQLVTPSPFGDVLYGPNTLPLTMGIVIIVIIALAGVLVYFKRRKG
jgi:hypothetical protein